MNSKKNLRQEVFKYLATYGKNIKAKMSNICSKTGSYSVPLELFQKRTSRRNRALISWATVFKNNLTYEQLETFESGVVVEFINNNFFDERYQKNILFNQLKEKLGSDDNVSSIISIRSESGSSSSHVQREAFERLIDNTEVLYKNKKIVLTEKNYKEYAINQLIKNKGQDNHTWDGFLFISIKGGQQDTIETHKNKELTLFNPACEYASNDVSEDINLVLAYFVLLSIENNKTNHELLFYINRVEEQLKSIEYDFENYQGNLYDYVRNHYSLHINPGKLTDPIQLSEITIEDFNIAERTPRSVDLAHNEAVENEKYYWDKKKKTILSAARPTNLFWSFHLSNMMQQGFNLNEYFEHEEEIFKKRQHLVKS